MDMFFALAEPRRRGIMELLSQYGQLSASDICKRFRISAPAISQHLKVLREAKLIKVEKRAQQRIYQINNEALLQVEEWIKKINETWDQRFDALDKLLEDQANESKNSYILK